MFLSRKWKIEKEFENLSLAQLNQAIIEAWVSLQKEKLIDGKEFQLLTVFIKANIAYDPKELLVDMYLSNHWSPHKSLLRLPIGELHELMIDQLLAFQQDQQNPFDTNKYSNMCLYIKSHILDEVYTPK